MKTIFHSKRPIVVIADDRERFSGVIESLAEFSGVSVQIRRLALGDYDVNGDLLVERKTTSDFALSLIDGRLLRQAYRLSNSDRRTCVILEGPSADLNNINVSRQALLGAMITVTMIFGQPVLRSQSPEETAWLMVVAANQLTRPHRRRPGRLARGACRSPRRVQSEMLQAVPGLGPDKAETILNHLGDIRSVASADLDDLMQIPGIGKVTAKRILWALCNSSNELQVDRSGY